MTTPVNKTLPKEAGSILEKIAAAKSKEVKERQELYPSKLLEKSIFFNTPTVSLKKYLARSDLVGIIAEIKRRSPSKGFIKKYINVEQLSIGYMQAGASALSVLTDTEFFGGSSEDLKTARKFNFCPILRKDFVIDEYQITEARSIGADAILLIAKILTPERISALAKHAKGLGLEVLLEVHSTRELELSLTQDVDVVGINNRDLSDFSVNVDRSFEIGSKVPKEFLKISESGIDSPETIKRLKGEGFSGFLIGEAFMRANKPEEACADLVRALR